MVLQNHDTMSVSEREQTKFIHRERRMSIMNEVHDIMRLRENQAAAKRTFGFLGSLTSKILRSRMKSTKCGFESVFVCYKINSKM